MSFLDGIVNTARNVLGIGSSDDASSGDRSTVAEPVQRSTTLATNTPTIFDRPKVNGGINRSFADLLRGTSATALSSPTFGVQPPHAAGDRSAAPPAQPSTDPGASTALGGGTQRARSPITTHARAQVYDAGSMTYLGSHGATAGGGAAAAAASNVQKGIDYFARTHGRDGLDDAGAGVNVLINDRSTDSQGVEQFAGNGGYFSMPQRDGTAREAIHFGTGRTYDAAGGRVEQHEMLYSDDLAIHELTHGIIRKETGHLGGEADEAGATNEAVADVMAAAATRDWRIGEGMYGSGSAYRSMRNIAQPDDPTAIHGLWTDISRVRAEQQANGSAEEHWASGVISTAAYRVQDRIGGEAGWSAVERVFYDTIDNHGLGDMSFTAVAAGLRNSAQQLYGAGSMVESIFDEELRRGGL